MTQQQKVLALLTGAFLLTSASATLARDADHEAAALADAIAENGCLLKEDEAPALISAAGIPPSNFPTQMFALMKTEHLVNIGDGVLELRNWGTCNAG